MSASSPIEGSLIQTAMAQQAAVRARDREKAAEKGRPLEDRVELRIAGVEDADAIRRLPRNDSEQAEEEQRGHRQPPAERGSSVDVKA